MGKGIYVLALLCGLVATAACGGGGSSPPPAPSDEIEDPGGGAPVPVPDISYASPLRLQRFEAMVPEAPQNTGGASTSFAVTPSLPAGLVLDATSGNIHGTPTEFRAASTYTVTASNESGTDAFGVVIEVEFGELHLDWPVPGRRGRDWVINNYVDLDSSEGGLLDFTGNTGSDAKVYDNHGGVDIDCPTFRAMDDDFPILAADEGVVVAIEDGQPDRNITCSGEANYVALEHPNGWTTLYLHLKRSSVVVSVGQHVKAGDKLGVIGSSGCSTAPHLHFQVLDPADTVVDPFEEGLWLDPPSYEAPFDLMELSLQAGVPDWRDLKDPGPDLATTMPGTLIAAKLSMAGGAPGDTFEIRWVRPDGSTYASWSNTAEEVWRHTYWYSTVEAGGNTGTWEVQVRLNGSLRGFLEFDVSN